MNDEPKKRVDQPKLLKVQGHPREAPDQLLGKREPGAWRHYNESGEPDLRRAHEIEDEQGRRHLYPAGRSELVIAGTAPVVKAMRWRYLD